MRFILLVVVLYCVGILLWVADAANARPAFPTTAQELAARVALPPSDHAPAEPQMSVFCGYQIVAFQALFDFATAQPIRVLNAQYIPLGVLPAPCPKELEGSK